MSQANVELAQRATDAVNDRNWDLWMDLMDPEIVYHEQAGVPFPGSVVDFAC